MKAQEKIRNANILLINIKALGNEIAKNLVLAGIGSITILDPEPITSADFGAQFFLSEDDTPVGTNRAVAASAALQRLNPRVRVVVDTDDIRTKPASFFAPFDIIIATDLDAPAIKTINLAARQHSRPFYAAASHGLFGFLFADLVEHTFSITRARANVVTRPGPESRTRTVISVASKPGSTAGGGKTDEELITKRESYTPFHIASSGQTSRLPDDILRSARRRRAVTPLISCFRALWEFEAQHGGSAPNPTDRAQMAEFTRLCGEQHALLNLPPETLRSEILREFLQGIVSSGGGSSAAAAANDEKKNGIIGNGGRRMAEIAPVAAVLGGQLAQDVINVLGGTQQPIQNFVFFDGESMDAGVYALHPPEGELGKALS
jgi:ubiquitin-like 1-activating enzyme E1 A